MKQDRTRSDLLDAARAEFAAHGYAGASVRAITSAAGANLGAITYHFGSKQALYEAVLDQAVGAATSQATAAAVAPGEAPLVRAGSVVRTFFSYFAEHPEVPRLMLQVLASREGPPPVVAAHLRRLLGGLAALVAEGQRDGTIRAGDPRMLAIAIISNPLHLNIVRAPLQSMLQIDLNDAAVRARLIDNAVHFVRGGLAAVPGGGAS
ncbi:MAG: TetR/AcrR family transcriptional regulator [Gemmatimonadetes bacterium]|nr:TetR/AcrR family transcriptional regulator [Gemmatimonadota bacterium]